MRRYQVLIESAFPTELAACSRTWRRTPTRGAWPARLRMDWAKGLPFEVTQVGTDVEDLAEVEYLFWVGCAGAYEDRQKKTDPGDRRAAAHRRRRFAVLGDGEACTGDPARRSGNEFLFQSWRQQNVETLNEAKAHARSS